MLSTLSVPLIPIGEGSQRAIVFMIELQRVQALLTVFINLDIIARLVYEHISIEPMVVQILNEKNSLLAFRECEDTEKTCNALQYIKMWFGSLCQY